jgi:hypothetical protein
MIIIILAIGGETVIAMFGGIENKPDWVKDVYNYIKDNKIQVGLFSFFGGAVL